MKINTYSSEKIEPVFSYGLFGLFLGSLVPLFSGIIIFIRLIDTNDNEKNLFTGGLMFVMWAICTVVGLLSGIVIGYLMKFLRSNIHWIIPIVISPVCGLVWGIVTGGLGGLPFVIIGGMFGAIVAGITGLFIFPVYAIVYEIINNRLEMKYWQIPIPGFIVSFIISVILAFFTYRDFN